MKDGIFDVNFDGKELKWQENQLLYRDSPIGDGNYKPAAFDAKVRFHLDSLLRSMPKSVSILIREKPCLSIFLRFGM